MIDFVRDGIERALASESIAAALAREGGGDRDAMAGLAAELEPFLRQLVDAMAFAIRASKDDGVGRAVAFANGQILHYLLDDDDLLPESELGVLGLLDDAFLVHHYAVQLLAWSPDLAAHAGTYRVPGASAFAIARALLPDGVADALERTSRNVLHVAISLIGGRAAAPQPVARTQSLRLRIDEARRARP
jgi:hypothetical protein